MKFKVGDEVFVTNCESPYRGYSGKIIKINALSDHPYNIDCLPDGWIVESVLELKNMNIKEQFALCITPEPQKSFRKVGITNGDNFLTEDGQKVFLSWLLNKNADAFKKEVVDDMLKEQEK